MEWNVYRDGSSAARACAEKIAALLEMALKQRDAATLALSGGSTPRLMFKELARIKIDWRRVHLFWADERCVPPGDAASNFKLADESLAEPAGIPRENLHRVEGERPPEEAAQLYAAEITRFFGTSGPSMPAFDVLHLGIGPDGHTASLFPGNPLTGDRERIAAAVFAPKFNQWRVTLLPSVLAAAANILILAAGADKREAIQAALHEPENTAQRPVQIVVHRAQWFLDRAAAGSELGDESAVAET